MMTKPATRPRSIASIGGALLLTFAAAASETPRREIHFRAFVLGDGRLPAAGFEILAQDGQVVTTDADGRFLLSLPAVFRPGETVLIQSEEDGWVMGEPPYGAVIVPRAPTSADDPIEIELHPEEDADLFFSDERIEYVVAESAALAKEHVGDIGVPPFDDDLDFYVARWSDETGWSAEKIRARIEAWIERSARSRDATERGLAAFARGQVGEARRIFERAAQKAADELSTAAADGATAVEEAELVREVVALLRLTADMEIQTRRIAEGLALLQRARDLVSRPEMPQLWAALERDAAIFKLEEFLEEPDGEESRAALREALEHLDAAFEVFTLAHFPIEWATLQHYRGRVFLYSGGLAAAGEQVPAFEEAARAFERAQDVRRLGGGRYRWAASLANLGFTYGEIGRLRGNLRHFTGAENALRSVLRTQTPELMPELWLGTVQNLADLKIDLAALLPDGGAASFSEGEGLYRDALRRLAGKMKPKDERRMVGHLAWHLVQRAVFEDENSLTPGWRRLAEALELYERLFAIPGAMEPLVEAPHRFGRGKAWLELSRRPDPVISRSSLGRERLGRAVEELGRAAELYREKRPTSWMASLHGRAQALAMLDRYAEAAAVYEEILARFPDWREGQLGLYRLEQHHRFRFAVAHEIMEAWTVRHPEDLVARLYLVECLFTSGRYEAAVELSRRLLADPSLDARRKAHFLAYEIASLKALSRPAAEIVDRLGVLRAMAVAEPGAFPSVLWFDGTLRAVTEDERLASHRRWLDGFFRAAAYFDAAPLIEKLDELASALGEGMVRLLP